MKNKENPEMKEVRESTTRGSVSGFTPNQLRGGLCLNFNSNRACVFFKIKHKSLIVNIVKIYRCWKRKGRECIFRIHLMKVSANDQVDRIEPFSFFDVCLE